MWKCIEINHSFYSSHKWVSHICMKLEKLGSLIMMILICPYVQGDGKVGSVNSGDG